MRVRDDDPLNFPHEVDAAADAPEGAAPAVDDQPYIVGPKGASCQVTAQMTGDAWNDAPAPLTSNQAKTAIAYACGEVTALP